MIEEIKNLSPEELMKSVIQRVATGPELSKNISREEAKASMNSILNREVSDVRSAIFLIALRMKRETEDENLGYIRLTSFNDNSSDQIEKQIKKLKKDKNLNSFILDLRNNPGGLLSQAIKISDFFLENGEIVSTKSRKRRAEKIIFFFLSKC